jgi:hypothetical protein
MLITDIHFVLTFIDRAQNQETFTVGQSELLNAKDNYFRKRSTNHPL